MHVMIALLMLSEVLAFGAFVIIVTKRESHNTEHLSLAIMSICLYIAGAIFEATSNNHFSAYRAIVLEYFGLPFIAPHVFLTFVEFYNLKPRPLLRRLLFVFPLLCTILVSTGRFHNLFYARTTFVAGPPPHLLLEPAPLYILSVNYTFILLLLAMGIIVRHIKKHRTHDNRRERLLLFALGLPIVVNLLYLFRLTPDGMDFTPIVLSITSGLLVYAVLRMNLLQLLPLAKSLIVEKMSDAFIIIDHQHRFLEANRAAKEIYPSLATLEVGDVFGEWEDIAQPQAMSFAAEKAYPPVRAPNGRYYHMSQTSITQRGKNECICIMLYDITETQSLIASLDKKASYDALTQVYNRGTFFQMAGMELAAIAQQDGNAAVMMFDLDHFKKVNDTYGHGCGDEVLRAATQRLMRRLRDSDVFGRYGGEEFCAFLMHITAENAITLANELRHCIEEAPFLWEGQSIPLTISVGVALYDKSRHDSLETMLGHADQALYAAKANGRNRVELFDGRIAGE